MLMVAVVLCGIAIVPLVGGSIPRLGRIRFTRAWLVFVGLGLQLAVTTVLTDLPSRPAQIIHIASYVFVLAFLVSNRHLPGVKLVVAGTLLNFMAIAANQGTMPARPAAVRSAGLDLTGEFENSAPVENARLQVLGDIFAVPESAPLSNVFSIGDVMIDAGAVVLILKTCRTRPDPSGSGDPADGQDAPEHASHATDSI
jgi:Family of unknown function (DUF5317)